MFNPEDDGFNGDMTFRKFYICKNCHIVYAKRPNICKVCSFNQFEVENVVISA